MRLQKYIALCGVASRRRAEALITDGRVTVNGACVTELGSKVQDGDTVAVDGGVIKFEKKKVYVALYKPTGVISSAYDDRGRKTVVDLVRGEISQRVYPVGRLDYDSEGLIFLTNDGDFANKLTHPHFEIAKEYVVRLDRTPTVADIELFRKGVIIDGRKTAPADISWVVDSELSITIREGRNRQIRKMAETLGYRVKNLKRISIGGVLLGNLPLGRWRHLTSVEIDRIMRL